MTEKTEKIEKYAVGEVATQTGMSAIDTETNKPITELELLVKLVNDVEELKTYLAQ